MFSYLASFVWENRDVRFMKKLATRLRKDGIDPVQLFAQLKETSSVMAGSYPLQVHLNETWNESDVDIFTANKEMNRYILQSYRPDSNSKSSDYGDPYFDCGLELGPNSKLKSPYSYMYGGVGHVTGYQTRTGKTIQVIKMQSDHPLTVHFVNDHFDFDICKVSFDGEKLYIANPSAVNNKKLSFDFSKEFKLRNNTFDRMVKYEKRGFTFTNRDEIVQAIEKRKAGKV